MGVGAEGGAGSGAVAVAAAREGRWVRGRVRGGQEGKKEAA